MVMNNGKVLDEMWKRVWDEKTYNRSLLDVMLYPQLIFTDANIKRWRNLYKAYKLTYI